MRNFRKEHGSSDIIKSGSCDFYPRATSPRLGAGAEGVGNGRETDPCRQPCRAPLSTSRSFWWACQGRDSSRLSRPLTRPPKRATHTMRCAAYRRRDQATTTPPTTVRTGTKRCIYRFGLGVERPRRRGVRSRRPAPPGVRGQGAQAATRAPARFAPKARETHGRGTDMPGAQRGAPFLRLRKNGRTSEHGQRGLRGHPTRTRYSLLGV